MTDTLAAVREIGQSVWYDNIRRSMITSGELVRMIEREGLLGMTSNPAIFEKALASGADYESAIRAAVRRRDGDAMAIFEAFAVEDIQWACDVFRPVYERTGGKDGYVSLEVSPYLAHDTDGTMRDAVRLHDKVARDNLMIKIPATPEGIPAIAGTIAAGISVNVTLLFAVEMYAAAADAYMTGLERRLAEGKDIASISSVASFFVSRIDTLIDEKLAKLLETAKDPERRSKIESLVGQVAIANAQVAYGKFEELYSSDRWKRLAAAGARPQRLLWASTGTKNQNYPKTLYVDRLVAPDTVNTLPAETYAEFRDRGPTPRSMTADWDRTLVQARATMKALADVGVSMAEATATLLTDGVLQFSKAFDKLLAAVETKRRSILGDKIATQSAFFGSLSGDVHQTLQDWKAHGKLRQVWAKDATAWTNSGEDKWLGWLNAIDAQIRRRDSWIELANELNAEGFQHAVVLGMGGSSLCPEVLARTFAPGGNAPELLVLDSTVPEQVATLASRINPAKTVFFVASKSGTTIEPNSFMQYFFERTIEAVGADLAGDHFVAITDPGTKMETIARQKRFRRILFGDPTIGGRYSALSPFGVAPAAAIGMCVDDFLSRAKMMADTCAASTPADMNPAAALGAAMSKMAQAGRDKLTIVCSPAIAALGGWLEQLVAESTGKLGKGVVPIADEEIGEPSTYGADRFFVYIRLASAASAAQDAAIEALEKSGQPLVRIGLASPMDLSQEFFRWELATALAGADMGINPFDQPDVESAKVAARKLAENFEASGKVAAELPNASANGMQFFAGNSYAATLGSTSKLASAADWLRAHLAQIGAGDYFAINAYVEMCEANDKPLQTIRQLVRSRKKVATTLGFGPRFLHSTGQLHKGGANNGVFLQITADHSRDLPIPGQKYTFGQLVGFQAQGDFEVLASRGRRIVRVHLGTNTSAALASLATAVESALA